MKHLPLLLVLAMACAADETNAPPIASLDGGDSSSDEGVQPESCTIERRITWLIDGEVVTPPSDVAARYVSATVEGEPLDVGCGIADGVPSCWVTCGPSAAQALSIDWSCGADFHELIDAPIPITIELIGCADVGSTSDESGSGSTDDTGTGDSSETDSGSDSSSSSESTSTEGSSDSGTDSGTTMGA